MRNPLLLTSFLPIINAAKTWPASEDASFCKNYDVQDVQTTLAKSMNSNAASSIYSCTKIITTGLTI